MGRKRKDVVMERNEMKLTKAAKSWDFTCSFCFKKFNSHLLKPWDGRPSKCSPLEEKRLFVRDPIAYRKRAFLQAIKPHHSSVIEGGSLPSSSSFHEAKKMVKNNETAANFNVGASKSCIHDYQRWNSKESSVGENDEMVKKLLAPKEKELSRVESDGHHQYQHHAAEEDEREEKAYS